LAVEEIFADLSKDKPTAARKVLGYLKENPDPAPITDAARRLIFRKGTDSHDYKFSSAVLEDYAHVSPSWRNRFLAASGFWLKGSGDKDSAPVERTRAARKGGLQFRSRNWPGWGYRAEVATKIAKCVCVNLAIFSRLRETDFRNLTRAGESLPFRKQLLDRHPLPILGRVERPLLDVKRRPRRDAH